VEDEIVHKTEKGQEKDIQAKTLNVIEDKEDIYKITSHSNSAFNSNTHQFNSNNISDTQIKDKTMYTDQNQNKTIGQKDRK